MKKQGVLHIVLGLIVLLRWPNDRLLFGAQLRTYTWTNARTNLNGLQRIWLHHWKRQLDRLAHQNTFNAQHITRSYKVLTPEVFPSSLWKHNTGAIFGYARGNVSLSMRNPRISKRAQGQRDFPQPAQWWYWRMYRGFSPLSFSPFSPEWATEMKLVNRLCCPVAVIIRTWVHKR